MTKLCPFRKETLYTSGRNTGAGYPDEVKAIEGFCECLQEKCMMYDTSDEFKVLTGKSGWCKMAR